MKLTLQDMHNRVKTLEKQNVPETKKVYSLWGWLPLVAVLIGLIQFWVMTWVKGQMNYGLLLITVGGTFLLGALLWGISYWNGQSGNQPPHKY